jgi:hypothetical protein
MVVLPWAGLDLRAERAGHGRAEHVVAARHDDRHLASEKGV